MGAFSPSLLFIPPPSPSGIAPFTPPSFRYTYLYSFSPVCLPSDHQFILLSLKVFLLCTNVLYFVPAPRESHLFERPRGRNPGGEFQPCRAEGQGAAGHPDIVLWRFFLLFRQTFHSYFVISLFRYSFCLIINPTIVLPVRFSARLIFYLFILSFVRLSDFPFFPVFLLTALFALAFLLNGLPSLMNLWTTLIDVFLLAGRNW